MVAIEGLSKIEDHISTLEDRPLEEPDQPQKSLGEIIFTVLDPTKDYQAASHQIKIQYEEAALYLFERWHEKIAVPFSSPDDLSWGAHIYMALTSENDRKLKPWEKKGQNNQVPYRKAASRAMKAMLIRAMTLEQGHINDSPPRFLYPTNSDQPPKSLGEIAYTTRFDNKNDFNQKSPKFQLKWHSAAQYLLFAWHQRIAHVITHFKQYSWGTHLYIGVISSRDNGYAIWTGEPIEIRESYNIAATRVIGAVLSHAIALQKERISGQLSDESLYWMPPK